jgi:hypothetical protein
MLILVVLHSLDHFCELEPEIQEEQASIEKANPEPTKDKPWCIHHNP